MDPATASALIGAGSSLLGGLFGRSSERKANAAAQRLNQQQFDQLFNHSIKARVEDAKRSGIHPMFALGANVSGPSLSPYVPSSGSHMGTGIAAAGQALATGFSRKQQQQIAQQTATSALQVNQSQVKLNEAQAQLALSEAKRTEQAFMSSGRDILGMMSTGIASPLSPTMPKPNFGGVKVTPLKRSQPRKPTRLSVTPQKSDEHPTRHGVQSTHVPMETPDGRIVLVPNPDGGMDEITSPAYLNMLIDQITSGALMNALPEALGYGKRGYRRFQPKPGRKYGSGTQFQFRR